MKIVVVSIFRRNYGGGEGRVAHEMADIFNQHHNVTLVCPGEDTGLHIREDGLNVFTMQSANREHVSLPLLSQVHLRELYSYLDAFQPDVIHAHDPALLGVVLQVWARIHRVPFVYTTHVLPSRATEFGTTDVLRLDLAFLAKPLANRFLLNFYENCDAVIALNQPAFEEVRRFGYTGPMSIIPNGRLLSHYDSRAIPSLEGNQRTLTVISSLSARKNQLYLLNVMQHLPASYVLNIAGSPLTSEYETLLREKTHTLGLQNVRFLGEVPHEHIAELLEETHALVSASTMEVQSLVVIEALASGTPVIGLSNETIDELVDDRVGARLPKDATPETFATELTVFLNKPAEAYRQSCLDARRAVKHLDWHKVMQRTIALYQDVLAENTGDMPSRSLRRHYANRILSLIPDHEWKRLVLDLASNIPVPSLPDHPVSIQTRMISRFTNTGSSMLYAAIKADQALRTLPRRLIA